MRRAVLAAVLAMSLMAGQLAWASGGSGSAHPSLGAGTVSNAFNIGGAGALPDLTVSSATGPGSATAGQPVTVSWTVYNAGGATATGTWSDAVYLSSTPSLTGATQLAAFSASGPLAAGASYANSQSVTIPANTPSGGHFLIVDTNAAGSLSEASTSNNTAAAAITVAAVAATATHLTLTGPASVTAGTAFSLTVTARDGSGNTVTGYTGTVHFASGDSRATLPGDYAFQAADQGSHTFSVTLATAGTQSVTVTDSSNPSLGGAASVSVATAGPSQLALTLFSAQQAAGTAFGLMVVAQDVYGNTATGYTGTVRFTTTGGSSPAGQAPVLPADYTFTGSDAGEHIFGGITLYRAGQATVTATDVGSPSITGTTPTISVSPGTGIQLAFSTEPGGGAAGEPWSIQPVVSVQDASGNTATASVASIALVIQGHPGGGALACAANPLPAQSGVAVFTGCSISSSGSGYTLQATSSGLTSATSASFDIAAGASQLAITTPAALPDATVNQAYDQTLAASGGTGPYTWSSTQLGGTGLTLSPSGVLSATAVSGPFGAVFGFTIQVKDHLGATASATFSLRVDPSAVQSPTVQPSPGTAFDAAATYTVSFTTSPGGALGAGDSITLASAPQGTVFSSVYTDYTVQGGSVPVTAVSVDSFTPGVTITLGGGIPAATAVVLVAHNVGNPETPGATDTLSVSTSQDAQAVQSSDYTITAIPPLPTGLAGSTVVATPDPLYYNTEDYATVLTVSVAVYLRDGSGTPLAGRGVAIRGEFPQTGYTGWQFSGPTPVQTSSGGEADFQAQCNPMLGGYCGQGPLVFAATDTTDGAVIAGPSVPVDGYSIQFGGDDYPGGTAQLSAVGLPAGQAVTATFNGVPLTLSGACATDSGGGLGGLSASGNSCSFTVPAGAAGAGYPVVLTAGGVPFQVQFQMGSNPAGTPASVAATAGGGQSAVAGTAFAADLVATVTDANGKGVAGVTVTFTAPAGWSFAGAASVQTVSGGVATAPALTAGTTAGAFTVTAAASGAGTASFPLTVTAGPAASIAVVAGDHQAAVLGAGFAAPLQARVTDQYGNAVPGATVTYTPPGTSAQTGSDGIAETTLIASGDLGPLEVDAATPGVGTPAVFHLTNASARLSSCDPATLTAAVAGSAPVWLLFPADCTLTLSQPVTISAGQTVTMDGTGNGVTLTTTGTRAFQVNGGTLTLIGLAVTNGAIQGQNGGKGSSGSAGTDAGFTPGTAGGDGAAGGAGTPGADAQGGAMYIAPGSTVNLTGTTFSADQAEGGLGGSGGNGGTGGAGGGGGQGGSAAGDGGNGGAGGPGAGGGNAEGGAIYNGGTLNVAGGAFIGDAALAGFGGAAGTGGSGGGGGQGTKGQTGTHGVDTSCLRGTGGGIGLTGGAAGNAGEGGPSGPAAPGANAQGGAIYNAGTLTISGGTIFAGDLAQGGGGGPGDGSGANGGVGGGGGQGGNGGAGGAYVVPVGGCRPAITDGGQGGNGGNGGHSGISGNAGLASDGGPGGAAEGGAIYNAGTLTIDGATFGDPAAQGNRAQGGNGGKGGAGGDAAIGPVAIGGGGGAGGCVKYITKAFPKGLVYPPCNLPGKSGYTGYGKQYGLGTGGGDGGAGGLAAGGAIYAAAGSTASLSGVTYGADNGTSLAANLVAGGQGGSGGMGGYSKCATVRGGIACFLSNGGGAILTGKPQPPGAAGANGPGTGAGLFTEGQAGAQLAIATRSLAGGSVGGGYWGFLQATGGTTPYTWSVAQGSLPPGLTLNPQYGYFSGAVTQAGSFLFTVQVSDSAGLTATEPLSITVPAQAAYVSGSTVAGSANAASATPNGTATAGGPGTPTGDVTATAADGAGQVAVTDYNANPGSGVSFQSTGQYFDVALSSGNTFQKVTVQKCGVTAADTVMWSPDGTSWLAVRPQSYSNGCITLGPLDDTSSSSPTLADLNGTPFAVAATAQPLAAGDTLTISPTPLAPAGSLAPGDTVSGSVYARTPGGSPVAGATVYLSLGPGAAGAAAADGTALGSTPLAVTTDGSGAVAVLYTAGNAISGTDTITAASDGSAAPAIHAASAYDYAAPVNPPATVTLLADPSQAAGGAAVTVSGAVYDSAGNPIADAVVDLSASAGSLSALAVPTAADGSYSATLTMPATGGATLAASVEGASPPITAAAIVTPPGIIVTGTASGATTAGGAGATAQTTARGTGGSGSIIVAEYSGDPGGAPSFTAAGAYFDVALAPGSTFTGLTITQCGVGGGDAIYWWNGSAWAPASNQSASGGCATVTVGASTSPSLADLTGTPFAVGAAQAGAATTTPTAGAAATSTAPTAASIGTSGGTLTTADGAFTMVVPAGALAAGQTLTASDAATAPAGAAPLPAGMTAASSFVTVAGGPLTHPVAATFRYQGALPDRLSVYALGSAGWTFAPTARRAGAVSAFIPGAGTYVVLEPTAAPTDVPAGFWATGAIDQALAAGIATGFPDGTFQPGAPVTRAQLAKMLVLALGLAPQAQPASRFADVAAGAWYAPYVGAAAQAGIVRGMTPARFAPDVPVTREQMAVMLARAFRLAGGGAAPFTDSAAIDAWAAAGVQATVAAGYMGGFPDGSFQPLAAASRAQAAKVLAAAIAALAP